MSLRQRLSLAFFIAFALTALTPVAGLAHANLVAADESAGAVTLAFSEPVQPIGQAIRVYSPDGRRADRGAVSKPGPAALRVAFDSARQGTYLVIWQVVSADTHPSRGALTFAVGTPGPVPQVGLPTGDVGGVAPLGLIIQALGRWLHFAAIALGFGAPFTALAVGAPASARIARLALAGAGLLIGGEVAWLVGQAASLGVSDQASLADIVASPAGRVMGLQLGAAIALWAFLGIGGRPRERSLAIAALGLAVCIVDGAAGHIVKGAPQPLGIALNAIHEGGMAVWVGAFLAVFPGRLSPVRVARIAVPSAAVAVLSGAILALVHIPTPAALLASPYGWTVVLKVAAVAATLAVSAFALRTRRPPPAELIALAVVLLIAGTLVSLPPPR